MPQHPGKKHGSSHTGETGHQGLRSGRDAAQENVAQSGPNRGTNTGTNAPGGVQASIGTTARAAQGRVGKLGTGDRKGAVRIPGATRGAKTFDGTRRGKGG